MMSNRLYLSAPLDVEGWESIEALEYVTLYEEFAERINDLVEFIREGERHWASHQNEDGEWTEDAIRILGEVRRRSSSIHQRIALFDDDLAHAIRWVIGELSASTVADSQIVAALAIDSACRAVETLGCWLADVDEDLYAIGREHVTILAEDDPNGFIDFLTELRSDQPLREIETRETVADLHGASRYYLTLARMYASPLLSSSEKLRISTAARKAGTNSAAVRRESNTDRNAAICSHAKRLLNNGKSMREIVGIIAGTDSALKAAGATEKLSTKQIRNVLASGGVLIATKTPKQAT